MLEEERNRILTKQKQRMKELQKLLATRVKAYDSHQGLAQMSKSRVNHLRYHGQSRHSNIGFQAQFFSFLSFPVPSFPFSSFPFLFLFLSFLFFFLTSKYLDIKMVWHLNLCI